MARQGKGREKLADATEPDPNVVVDNNAGNDPRLTEIYVNKYFIAASGRDTRIAFGTLLVHYEDGKKVFQPNYRVAIYLSHPALVELAQTLAELVSDLKLEAPRHGQGDATDQA